MAGKWQLLLDGENSHANTALALRNSIPRKDKCGLGQIHFAGDALHFAIAQASCVREHGQRVALERLGSEDIKLYELEAVLGTDVRHGK
jgi:hypothetical protein